MRRGPVLMGLALALTVPACAGGSPPSTVPASAATEAGYLAPDALQTLAQAVPAAPVAGSDAAAADRAGSLRMRALENGDRWLLATRHAELRPALGLSHFDCALGFRIDAAQSPRLTALLGRLLADADAAAERAKARGFRARPVGDDPDRPACQTLSPAGRASASHPSGSAAVGAVYAEALALLAPAEAAAVREIGRQIGISRVVCAMHYPSDVAAGQALGRSVFQAVAATPAFQADLRLARADVERARGAGATSPACAAERAALALPLP